VWKTKFHNHTHRTSQPSRQQSLSWRSMIPSLSRIPCNLSWRRLFESLPSHFQESSNYLKLDCVSSLPHIFRLIVHSSFRHVHMWLATGCVVRCTTKRTFNKYAYVLTDNGKKHQIIRATLIPAYHGTVYVTNQSVTQPVISYVIA